MSNTTFREMSLNPNLLTAIEELSFETPTPVQEKTIPFLLENKRDLIALAQTGTGKTAAFGLPIIESIEVENRSTQALILCPTRELCIQLTKEMKSFCKYMKGISITAIYGGASIDKQSKALDKGVHIIAATPGRMNDFIRREKVDFSKLKTLVLDEADEMLNMGFKEELDLILAQTPEEKNTLLFSATMLPEVAAIAKNYMNEPYEITVGKKNVGADNVEHIVYMVHSKDRYLALKRVADINPNIYGIVFCRTRAETKDVADRLIEDGYNADALHGDLSQVQRDNVMSKFRNKNLHMLVATDVAARGLDVDDLSHIINYNLPDDYEVYTHRSGRTGRAGKSGTSIAIINMKEKSKIRRIEKMIKKKFEQKPIPVGKEICEAQLYYLIDRMQKVDVDEEQISPFMDVVYEKLNSFSKEDLIKHFVSLEFNRFLDYYRNARDLNTNIEDKKESKKRTARTRSRKIETNSSNFDRIYINLGKSDKLKPKDLISLINKKTDSSNIPIGSIDSKARFTFFDVADDCSNIVLESLNGISMCGRTVLVERANPIGRPTKDKGVRKSRGGQRKERSSRKRRRRS